MDGQNAPVQGQVGAILPRMKTISLSIGESLVLAQEASQQGHLLNYAGDSWAELTSATLLNLSIAHMDGQDAPVRGQVDTILPRMETISLGRGPHG